MAPKNTLLDPMADYWDVTPFTTAPAIQELASAANGGHHIITIPNSPYPSPLVEDITPQSLKTLHDTLTAGNSIRGQEVWKAWKRAWDLWNNHYIEGRANPRWIQEELKRRKEERSKVHRGRPKYPRFRPKGTPEVHGIFEGQKEELVIPAKGRKWVRARNDGSVRIQDGTEEKKSGATRAVTRKVMKQRLKTGKRETKQIPQVKEIQQVKVSRKVPYYLVQPWSATVTARQTTGYALPALSEGAIQPEDQRTVNTIIKVKKIQKEPQDLVYMRTTKGNLTTWTGLRKLRIAGKSVEVRDDRISFIGKKTTDKVWQPVLMDATADAADADMEWYEDTETVEEDVLEDVDRYVTISVPRWELVDDLDNPAPSLKVKKSNKHKVKRQRIKKQTTIKGKLTLIQEDEDEDHGDDAETLIESSNDEMEEDKWIHNFGDEVVETDQDGIVEGWSGGFLAMKYFQGNEETGLDDAVANTVWRPIWVGEEDSGEGCGLLDGLWNEQRMRGEGGGGELRESGLLEKDGGVDAGAGPFACLRWMYKYVRCGRGGSAAYRKRKVWDEVTGTIFNMPMVPYDKSATNREPLPSPTKPVLDNHSNVSRLINPSFSPFPEKDYERNNIFPLDIRRLQLLRASEADKAGRGPQLTLEGENLVTTRYNNPKRIVRSTLADPTDPWYVTEEEEGHRDVPIRHWPLFPNNEFSKILPFDETHYLTHRMRDRLGEAAYFVTNLFGATLVINGQAIRKGQIAGPLPKFAVIETPGGQVSFWWGENGRGYGDDGVRVGNEYWEILRRYRGWEFVGRSAGEVWDERIIDRLKREEMGEEENEDDDEWAFYRNWKEEGEDGEGLKKGVGTVGNLTEGKDYFAEPQVVIIADPKGSPGDEPDSNEPDNSNLILAPEQFASAEQELKYLAIENPLIEAAVNAQVDQPVIPLRKETWWQGPIDIGHCENQDRVRQVTVDEIWKASRSTFIARQEKLRARIETVAEREKATIFQREVEAKESYETEKKRKAADDGGQPRKRPRESAALLLQRRNGAAAADAVLQGITAQRRKDVQKLRELQAAAKRKQLEKEAHIADLKRKNKFTHDVAERLLNNWEAQKEMDEQVLIDKENVKRKLAGLPPLRPRADFAVEAKALSKKLAKAALQVHNAAFTNVVPSSVAKAEKKQAERRLQKEQEVVRANVAATFHLQKDEAAAKLHETEVAKQVEILKERMRAKVEARKMKKQENDFNQAKGEKAKRDNIAAKTKAEEEKKSKDGRAAEFKAIAALGAALNEAAIKEAIHQNAEVKRSQHANIVRILKSLRVSDITIAGIMSLYEAPLHGSPFNNKLPDWSQAKDLSEDDIALYRGLFDPIGELRMATFNMHNKRELSSEFEKKFAQYTNDLIKLASPSIPPAELEAQRKADLEAAMEAQAIVDGITPAEMYMKQGYCDFKEWYAAVEKADKMFFLLHEENPKHYSSAKKQANSDMRFYACQQARQGLKNRADYEYHGDQAACLKERYNCNTEEEYLQLCVKKLAILEGMPPELEKPMRKEGKLTKAEEVEYQEEKAKFEAASRRRGMLQNAEKGRYDYNTKIISEEIRDSEAAYLKSRQPPKITTKNGMTSREI